MPRVEFTAHLSRYFPDLAGVEVPGGTVAEVLDELEERHPGLKAYLVDERGALRQHVNVFIGSRMVTDRKGLTDEVGEADRLHVFQALSGG